MHQLNLFVWAYITWHPDLAKCNWCSIWKEKLDQLPFRHFGFEIDKLTLLLQTSVPQLLPCA